MLIYSTLAALKKLMFVEEEEKHISLLYFLQKLVLKQITRGKFILVKSRFSVAIFLEQIFFISTIWYESLRNEKQFFRQSLWETHIEFVSL